MNPFQHPIYSLLLTLGFFMLFLEIQNFVKNSPHKWLSPLLNPVLMSIIAIIATLSALKMDYDTYKTGTQGLSLPLYPATVSLAVPLYRNLPLLKRQLKAIALGVLAGVLTNALVVPLLGKALKLEHVLLLSLLPKSITTPIGMIISEQIGARPEITVPVIVISGIVGIVLGPIVFKLFRIDHRIARGISLGTASHALGTSKAIELGDVEGGMGGLAIGLTGLTTALLLPILIPLLKLLRLL